VELAWEGWKPSQWLTDASFRNAVRTWLTIGGSTNAIVHLIAMARRAEVALSMEDFDQLSRTTPVLADIRPCGRFLMEDFHRAGGLMALLQQLEDLLETAAMGVGGHSLREAMERGRRVGDQVIRSRGNPVSDEGGVFVLRGNLAPDGCVTKALGADPRLRRHRGPAIVFDSYRQMQQQIHDPNLDVTADHVLVLRSAGPLGAPGFPEWGMLPIPRKLLQQGVRDMVRISDARMSGTSYGTCVLHVSPESHLGGPLACVRTGDWISLDLDNRTIQWEVSDQEAQLRKEAWRPSGPSPTRGYHRLYANHVTQAQDGCDFDFLEGRSPGVEPDIF
jgi:dihydroxy-acid dehydratase